MGSEDTERLHKLVGNAEHESVTVDRLSKKKRGTGRPRLNDRPPISYLRPTGGGLSSVETGVAMTDTRFRSTTLLR